MPSPTVRSELDPLVQRGQLTPAQADAVAAHLAARRPSRRTAPVAIEAVGYLGAALSAAALLRVGDHYWSLLEVWAQTGLLVLVAVALWAGGAWVRTPQAAAGADRLAGVLWVLATVAATGAAAVVLHAADVAGRIELSAGQITLALGGVAAAVAVPLWIARRGALQLLTVYAATTTLACGALLVADVEAVWAWGVVVTALGVAWSALAWGGLLAPRRAALVLGTVTAVVGPQLIGWDADWLGLGLGLVVSLGVLAASVWTREAALAGIGTIATTAYLLRAVADVLPGELGWTVGLLVAGVTLLSGALATFRLARGGPRHAAEGAH